MEYTLQPSPSLKQRSRGSSVFGVEKAWTPSLTFSTPGDFSVAFSQAYGYSYLLGSTVFLHFKLTTSSFTHTTAAGWLAITGLPYQVAAAGPAFDGFYPTASEALSALGAFVGGGNLHWQGITKANYTHAFLNPVREQKYLSIIMCGSGQVRNTVNAADMPTGGSVVLGGFCIYTRLETAS
jgi:hypothetical protein